MMNWNKLRVFEIVARAGSFTQASKMLNLSQSAVSRQISALETDFEVPLFHRHARGLILTEQGEDLYETVKEVADKLSLTHTRLQESREKTFGQLRITTSIGLGSYWLIDRISYFIEQQPNMHVSIVVEDHDLDLNMREADVAIRLHPSQHPDLIQRYLVSVPLQVYASPKYIEKYGKPHSIQDLVNHKLILFSRGNLSLIMTRLDWMGRLPQFHKDPLKPVLTVNNIVAMVSSIERGIGIGALPKYVAVNRPNLIQILKNIDVPLVKLYLVYPQELRTSKKIRAFGDFIIREFNKHFD